MEILRDASGNPIPQYQNAAGTAFEELAGVGGAMYVNVKDPLPAGSNNIGKVGIDTSANAVTATIAKSSSNPIVLLNSVTAATNGTYVLQGEKTIVLRISGTSTSRAISFKCTYDDGVVENIMGYKRPDLSISGLSTTGTGETWEFDVTGCVSFIVQLTAVTGGNVTIKGRAVA